MIKIYNISGNVIKQFDNVPIGSTRKAELMKEDFVTIPFSALEYQEFKKGSYATIDGVRFEVTDNYKPTWNGRTGGYDYSLRLDAWYFQAKGIITKLQPASGNCEVAFKMTTTLQRQASIIVANFAAAGMGTITCSVDDSVKDAGTSKFLEYNATGLIDAITMIAEAWNCEWWFEGSVLHFGKCESGTAENLVVGGNVSDYRPGGSSKSATTRLIAFGSTRNLPKSYRNNGSPVQDGVIQKRLMMPSDTPYLDKVAGLNPKEIVEEVVIFDGIYPRFTSAVSSVETYTPEVGEGEEQKTYYRISTNDFTFSDDFILPGETLRVEFTSGPLSGFTFEARFNPKNVDPSDDGYQMFEIIVNQDYGIELPNGSLHPAPGNSFILTGWDSTRIEDLGLVANAENELKQCAQSYMANMDEDGVSSSITMKSIADGSNIFPIGRKVTIKNGEESRASRVVGFTIKLDIPGDSPTYTIGNSPKYSTMADLRKEIKKGGLETAASINELQNKSSKVDLSAYKTWAETTAKLGMTEINGGYILSKMIALTDTGDNIMAGMNGLYNESAEGGGAAAWYGGAMDSAKTLFRFDGSGFVANGNISWNSNGQVTLSETAKILGTNVTMKNVADMTDLWEKVNIGTASSPIWAVKSKYHVVSEGELVGYYNGEGLNIGGGGGDGASSIKYGSQIFNSVDGVIDISQINISGGVSSWNDLTDKPTWIGASKPSYNFSEIGAKPTTISGYGITDAITTGNIGSQSVMYAHGTRDKDHPSTNTRYTTANNNFADGALHYYLATSSMTTGKPTQGDSQIIHCSWDNGKWESQLAVKDGGRGLQTRHLSYNGWSDWQTVAYIDDNVTSATKLQTARSLWGNSFDGSSNIGGSLIPIADNTHQIGTNNARWTLGYFGWVGGATNNSFNLGANNSTHMTFTTSGNVGIGTTSPSTKLHVYGTTTTYAVSLRRTTNTSLSAAGWYKIGRMVYASVYGNGAIIYINRAYSVVNNESYVVSVNDTHDAKGAITQISGAANSRLIEKVAIVPHASDVGGDVYIYYKGGSDNSVSISAVGQIDLQTPTLTSITPKYSISLVDGASVYGNILVTGESTAYSDARLKTDIKDLDFRGALMPKSFVKDGKQSIGFIAQEVRKLYPELVHGEETEDSYLSLNYGAITAVLACQTNKHDKQIEMLKKRVSKLENEVKLLKAS
ncbi:MAG: tail fiber domain-containing protein [Fibrobacter sp.]|nr:tail fiber domain-containing protein [Fibrobacter sp.]